MDTEPWNLGMKQLLKQDVRAGAWDSAFFTSPLVIIQGQQG